MSFLSPLFLLGGLAVAAPILIHLIRRRKITVVQWAAHRFLLAATRKLQKRRRIEDLLLLLLRCLLFLLLALLFARPLFYVQDEVAVTEEDNLVLLVDASASMGFSDGVQSNFDRARDQADTLLDALPTSAGVMLILFADQAYPIVGRPTTDRNVIRNELARQRPKPGGSDLVTGLSASIDLLSSVGGGSIIVLSDGQATAWSEESALRDLTDRAEEASIELQLELLEGREAVENLGIVEFEPLNERPITGEPLQLRALVRNGGATRSEPTRLFLEKEPDMPIKESPVPALEPGEVTTVFFETRFDQSGAHLLSVRLPRDRFAADDSRSIGLDVSGGIRVGVVEGRYTASARAPSGFFIRAAAVPVDETAADSFPVRQQRLDSSALRDPDTLAELDVVVLTGIGQLDTMQGDALKSFVSAGGGLWINPPSDPSAAERFLLDTAIAELIGGTGLVIAEQGSSLAASPPYNHPITEFWNESSAGSLSSFFVDRYLRMEPSKSMQSVLKLRNGDFLFGAVAYRQGRVFLSAIPMDNEWSELPLAAQFVPLVQRTISWLSGRVPPPSELRPGQSWSTEVAIDQVGRPFYVVGASDEGDPEVAGKVEFREGSAQIAFSDTRRLGRYKLFLEEESAPVGAFGVNLNEAESDLRPVDAVALTWFGSGSIESAQAEQATSGPGWFARFARSLPDLWVLLAVLLLIGALAESYLAHRFSQPR